ncbi:MAG: hypothetical protein LBK53_01005 [Heliobacteriaceae bacterium]|jgi:hypothetical protein|nr:hypothetical protein [Heliobacteriaceae bacterium]
MRISGVDNRSCNNSINFKAYLSEDGKKFLKKYLPPDEFKEISEYKFPGSDSLEINFSEKEDNVTVHINNISVNEGVKVEYRGEDILSAELLKSRLDEKKLDYCESFTLELARTYIGNQG